MTFTAKKKKKIHDVFSIREMRERVYNSSSKPNQTGRQRHHRSSPADRSAHVNSQLLLTGQLPSPCATLVYSFN